MTQTQYDLFSKPYLRHIQRRKNGKEHSYGSIVESRRLADGRVSQRHVLYLGEINNAQERGVTFIEPMTPVYEGMIVGQTNRPQDIPLNVCKEKKMTNIRSSTKDIAVKLSPPVIFSLEQAIDFIERDELLEVTPKSLRLRKKILNFTRRLRQNAMAGREA